MKQLEGLKQAKKEMQVVIKTNPQQDFIHESIHSDDPQEFLGDLVMRPLIGFKMHSKVHDSKKDGLQRYAEIKQKESALESLSDINIAKITSQNKPHLVTDELDTSKED
jgi:hypothetical protein